MPVKYDEWSRLDREGAYVHVPDTEPSKVSHLAKAYVRKHLSPDAKVVTVSTPRGTFVAVAYVPPRAEDPAPQPDPVESPTKRQLAAEARRLEKEAKDAEALALRRDSIRQSLSHAIKDTEGYGEPQTVQGGDDDPDNIWK